MKKCPECAEEIQDDARRCRHCAFRVDGASEQVGAPGALNLVAGSVSVEIEARSSRFYQLTDAEIENYAGLGHGANLLVSLGTTFGGFALGCYVAVQTGGAAATNRARLTDLGIFGGVVAALFLLLWVGALRLQRRYKEQWVNPGHKQKDPTVKSRSWFQFWKG